MKNQNFEVSCEVLFEMLNNTELQETVGGAWYSCITDCFKSKSKTVTPTQTYRFPTGGNVELRAGALPEVFAVT